MNLYYKEIDISNLPFRLSQLKNGAPQMESWLNAIDIHTLEEIRKVRAVHAYKMLEMMGYNVSLVGAYAIQGALMNLHWNKIPQAIKDKIKMACKE